MTYRADLCVIGGGSGGIGAALAAARLGRNVVLVEKAGVLGGTSTLGGVNSWEPTAGATGITRGIYDRLRRIPNAVGITYRRKAWERDAPFALWGVDPDLGYDDTLRRSGVGAEGWHTVVTEPDALATVAAEMLSETGLCTVLLGTAFVSAETDGDLVTSVTVERGGRRERLQAPVFVDATGDGLLADAVGCESMLGEDARRAFGEPDAPDSPSGRLNGVTLVYRIRRTDEPCIAPLPSDVPGDLCTASTNIVSYPCGDMSMNALPTMTGDEAWELGPRAAFAECRRRAASHWHWLQTSHGFDSWRRVSTAPMLGVRELRRVVGEHVLTEHDLLAGLSGQTHDDVVAITDHAVDLHGHGGGCKELAEPYGVPYRCLIARDARNLLVASRCASFSHIAASSCRLSRTMIQLGQAAGTAAALCRQDGSELRELPPDRLRASLMEQGVQLEV